MSPLMSTLRPWQSCVQCDDHRDDRRGFTSPSELTIARRRAGNLVFWEAWCSGGQVPSTHHAQAMDEASAYGEPYIHAAPPEGWTLTCTRCTMDATDHDGWRLLERHLHWHNCAK